MERVPSPPLSVSVGTTSTKILEGAGVSKRIDLVITNTSTAGQTISLGFGTDAVAGGGVVLQAGIGISFSRSERYEVMNLPIFAVSSAANGSVAVWVRSE